MCRHIYVVTPSILAISPTIHARQNNTKKRTVDCKGGDTDSNISEKSMMQRIAFPTRVTLYV